MKTFATVGLTVVMVCLCVFSAQAQTSNGTGMANDSQSARIAKLEQAVALAKSAGDNAWMLVSSALVLMMTGPGLALFYGGLVRRKNVLGTMMHSFILMAVVTVVWLLIVYLPMAHMVWGKGGLLNAFLGGKVPCFDFAGGTVVHITSGVSALVCALYLGKRQGYMV